MSINFSYKDYLSSFTYRYASSQMRYIFSEENSRLLWHKIWQTLAKIQMQMGLISKKEYQDIFKNYLKLDIKKSLKIEKEIHHELMAELKTMASFCKTGGGKLHLGATSTDILDNADILKIKQALEIIEKKLIDLLKAVSNFIKKHKNVVCMGFTHLQPAEPTTMGYRFCQYGQDLLEDLKQIKDLKENLRTKGLKGAVGTGASFVALFGGDVKKAQVIENKFLKELGLKAFDFASQTYPRKQDLKLTQLLANIAQSLHKMAFDIRFLQSPAIGEIQEQFTAKQVGSSAMPFKRNPVLSERICSLAEYIKVLPQIAWNNAADTLLERTLDDSANRRIFIPEGFLACDEILNLAVKVISNLKVNFQNIKKNLDNFGTQSALEPLMMELTRRGLNRQKVHEKLRILSQKILQDKTNMDKNSLFVNLLMQDKEISKKIKIGELKKILDYKRHTGWAVKKCEKWGVRS